jgi:hypothetical protein
MPPARKATGKRPAAARKPVTVDGEPLLEITTDDADEAPVAMEPAFTINGTVFSTPAEVPAQVAVRYMDHCRKKGDNWGLSWLLEEVLGADAYEAFLTFNLKDDHLVAIAKIVQSKVMGDTTPKDSRRR